MFAVIWYIGLVTCAYLIFHLGWWIYSTFFRPIDLKRFRRGQSWALVTGSTDGIGLAYAQVLAEHGFNILLVSRSSDRLEVVKKDILSRCKGIQVDWVVSNATDCGEANFQAVVDKVATRDLAILVNNVGIGQGGILPLTELQSQRIEECVRVNCVYPTLLTKALLPALLRHTGPKLLINLSSLAALTMNPFSSVYSGSKAFNRQFSRALSAEYAPQGLEVLCVEPGFVESSMTKMKPGPICCTARECVTASLRKIGDIEAVPHWKHGLTYALIAVLGDYLPSSIAPMMTHKAIAQLRTITGRLGKRE